MGFQGDTGSLDFANHSLRLNVSVDGATTGKIGKDNLILEIDHGTILEPRPHDPCLLQKNTCMKKQARQPTLKYLYLRAVKSQTPHGVVYRVGLILGL